jgi:sporulation protein YlmC with PRC-barrel domain
MRIAALFLMATVSMAPAFGQSPAAGPTGTSSASTGSDSAAKVVVSTVRLENGFRASRIIGATIYNEQNESIGTVSDLFISKPNQVSIAVIQVGGFLGVGGKLVSVPFEKLQVDHPDKIVMPQASRDELKAMPGVEYGEAG